MRFVINSKAARQAAVEAVRHLQSDPLMDVVIEPHQDPRNLDQNAYFHSMMRSLSRKYEAAYGELYAPDVWKEYMKRQFLGQESRKMPNGKTEAFTRHTSDLSKKEMSHFIDDCKELCAMEYGINLDED